MPMHDQFAQAKHRPLDGTATLAGYPQRSRVGPYPLTIALCAVLLGVAGIVEPIAALLASFTAGALFVLRRRKTALAVAIALVGIALAVPAALASAGYWSLLLMMMTAVVLPAWLLSPLLRLPYWIWALAMVGGAASVWIAAWGGGIVGVIATVTGALCGAALGGALTRHLAMVDARLLAWDEGGIVTITRDLLLGRIVDGMLHDLAQPLNVISMANANLGYLLDGTGMPDTARLHFQERIERIGQHTEKAADILSLFRSLGRTDERADGQGPAVREVLERSVAAMRSSLRRHIVTELAGTALDQPLPGRQDTLELMTVAALLCVFGAHGAGRQGKVTLHAALSPAHVVITLSARDEDGQVLPCQHLDNATRWLVEQLAREAQGDFRHLPASGQTTQLVMRLARQDI